MKTLYYLSIPSFFDTDRHVLKLLGEHFAVTYGVIVSKNKSNHSTGDIVQFCKQLDIDTEFHHLNYRLRDLRCLWTYVQLMWSIRKKAPDLVYSFSFDNPFLALTSFCLARSTTIIFIHDVEFHSSYNHSRFLRIGRNITVRFFRYFQVFSDNQLKKFKEKYDKKRVWKIDLPLKDFGVAPNRIEFGGKIVKLLFFGKVLPYKGVDLLLKSLDKLGTHVGYQVVIAGEAPSSYDEYISGLMNRELPIKRVHSIKNSEIPSLFADSHFLVLPYRDGTQSGPLMISYYYNVPVIASNIEAFENIVVEGTTGFKFEAMDVESLAKVLYRCITMSAEHYNMLLTRMDAHVQELFSESVTRRQLENLLSGLLEPKRSKDVRKSYVETFCKH